MYRICLVEDEVNLNNLMKSYLERESYEVINFYSGEEASQYVGKETVHLWILDIMLGDNISGYDLIKKIRENNSDVPVIFTSARDQDLDKIIGLELGSDDYVTKPYSPKELVLRVNNFIKRIYSKANDKIIYEGYEIDFNKRLVFKQEKEIVLTTLEFDLLIMFMENKNKSFSRDDILKHVWGEDYFGSDRVVDDLVRRLRKKMPNIHINTLYGFGYRLI
ncbi:MAG: response regulator transcription factor [Bacilli bacterium]|nr:response regulator transcription factor [Bacilli bacterium]